MWSELDLSRIKDFRKDFPKTNDEDLEISLKNYFSNDYMAKSMLYMMFDHKVEKYP